MVKQKLFSFLHKKGTDNELLKLISANFDLLNNKTKTMLKNIIDFKDTVVREIMVPRIDVKSSEIDENIKDIVNLVVKNGHSRVPIYEKTIDNVIGILYIKDIVSSLNTKFDNLKIRDILRPAYFVPESKKIIDLLREFQQKKIHLAVVVDEFGGMSGIVSLEDILEEIVGEIQDEYDNEQEPISKLSENCYVIDARLNIEDINERLNTYISSENVDTVGGFVFSLFAKIPSQGEKISYQNLDFTIEEVIGHKIAKIKLYINPVVEKEVVKAE